MIVILKHALICLQKIFTYIKDFCQVELLT